MDRGSEMNLLEHGLAIGQTALLSELLNGHVQEMIGFGTLEAEGAFLFEATAPIHERILQEVDQRLDVALVTLPLVTLEWDK